MKDHEPIPGERDRTTQTETEPGIVGTTGYGADLPDAAAKDPTLSEADRDRSRWEGGGRVPKPAPDEDAPDGRGGGPGGRGRTQP